MFKGHTQDTIVFSVLDRGLLGKVLSFQTVKGRTICFSDTMVWFNFMTLTIIFNSSI